MTTRHRPQTPVALAAALALAFAAPVACAEDPPLGPFGGDRLWQELADAERRAQQADEWQRKAEEAEGKLDAAVAEASKQAAQACKTETDSQITDLKRQLEQCGKTAPKPQSAATLPRDLPKDCAECPQLVELPPGGFQMGSPNSEKERSKDEGPRHQVTIGYRLAVGKYEVTRAEFARFAKDQNYTAQGGCYVWTGSEWKTDAKKGWRDPGFAQTDNDPVACVNWDDAQAYVAWLNRKAGLGKDAPDRYRLLSEAEWEYAARATTETAYWWGYSVSHEYANYGKDQCCGGLAQGRDQWEYTAPVGSFPANRWGLHDMHGNVWEWVADCYHDSYNGAPGDGSAWDGGMECANGRRVLRGGSWNFVPQDLRSAFRSRISSGNRYDYSGFRPARTLTP